MDINWGWDEAEKQIIWQYYNNDKAKSAQVNTVASESKKLWQDDHLE